MSNPTPVTPVTDYRGKLLEVGDFIVYCVQATFRLGLIKSISPLSGKMRVAYVDDKYRRHVWDHKTGQWIINATFEPKLKTQTVYTQWRDIWKPSGHELTDIIAGQGGMEQLIDAHAKIIGEHLF